MEKLFPLHPDGPHHTALVHSSGNAHIDIIDDMQYGYQKDYRKETIDKYGKGKLYCLCFFFVFSGIGKIKPQLQCLIPQLYRRFFAIPFFQTHIKDGISIFPCDRPERFLRADDNLFPILAFKRTAAQNAGYLRCPAVSVRIKGEKC